VFDTERTHKKLTKLHECPFAESDLPYADTGALGKLSSRLSFRKGGRRRTRDKMQGYDADEPRKTTVLPPHGRTM